MRKLNTNWLLFLLTPLFFAADCNRNNNPPGTPTAPYVLQINAVNINNVPLTSGANNISTTATISIKLNKVINRATVNNAISIVGNGTPNVVLNFSYLNNDSVIVINPATPYSGLSSYTINVAASLQATDKGNLYPAYAASFNTQMDTTNKFPIISDSALLDLVQKQTLKYFWDFGHPVCGLASERTSSGDIVTTGGSGFGIMAIIAATNRGFIARADAVTRLNLITNFLTTKCQRWHGAFSHWINGSTGATVPFGNNNGADIVETSYLLQGLLCARQYFNNTSNTNEKQLTDSINSIWNKVEWNWFTQNGTQQGLYWQYNPTFTNTSDIWSISISGWNESLITYVLAASSPNYAIAKNIYTNGWAQNGAIKNGATYYGISLPLGEAYGGPLFFAHYSFLGINPNGLSDAYANYMAQNIAHATINYNYCVANPKKYLGYSSQSWGLTASDVPNGYTASSPTNDVGVIAPTAALSSLPYTPLQSMNALRFFYYKLGDKILGNYGFLDAFNLNSLWFDSDCLAIDQGPIIVMIENYRSGLLWNLFTSCPEVKNGMKNVLGFSAPYL